MLIAVGAVLLFGATATGASGARSAPPEVVLNVSIGSDLNPPSAGVAFADAVRRLSNGRLAIAFRSVPEGLSVDSELLALREVRTGSTEMGWIPTRGWDTQGLKTFTALQAPFLITDYTLLQKVLSEIGQSMLPGTRSRGVRTLGLVATDLRRLLGARKPFVAPADFRGAKLRVPAGSRVSSTMLEALGATPVQIASGVGLEDALKDGTVDGAETSFGYILLNGYYAVATHVTANLVFYPRVDAISINERAFQALAPHDRTILEKAAAQVTKRSFVGLAARDREQLRLLCAAGLKAAGSTSPQLSALRRTVQPVYETLKEDRATARRIAQIQKLKKGTRAAAPLQVPAGCAA